MKYLLPVLAGLAVTTLSGLALYPLVSAVFDQFFHLYLFSDPPADRWKDDIIIWATIALWIFTAAGIGGFVCSFLSQQKEDFSILLFIVAALSIVVLFSRGTFITDLEIESLIPIGIFTGGACAGNLIALKRKSKKLINNPPSPPEQP